MFREYESPDYYEYDENGVKYVTTPRYDSANDIGLIILLTLSVEFVLTLILLDVV